MSGDVRQLPVKPRPKTPVQPEAPDARPELAGLTITLPVEIVDAIVHQVKAELGAVSAGPEKWVGVAEAADHIACKPQRIYDLVSRKDSGIPHRKEGSRLLFKRSQLDKWLDGSPR